MAFLCPNLIKNTRPKYVSKLGRGCVQPGGGHKEMQNLGRKNGRHIRFTPHCCNMQVSASYLATGSGEPEVLRHARVVVKNGRLFAHAAPFCNKKLPPALWLAPRSGIFGSFRAKQTFWETIKNRLPVPEQ